MFHPPFSSIVISLIPIVLVVAQPVWGETGDTTVATLQLKNGQRIEGKVVYDGDDGITLITQHGEVFYKKDSVQGITRRRMSQQDYHISRGDYWAREMLDALNDEKRFASACANAIKQYKMAQLVSPDMELAKRKLAYVEAQQEEWRQKQIKLQELEKAKWEASAAKSEFRRKETELKLYAKQMKALEEQRKFMKRFPKAMKEFEKRLDRIEDLLEDVTDESDRQLRENSNQIAAIRQELLFLRNSLLYFGNQYNIAIPRGTNK